jgi:hypothetical protein
MGTPLGADCLLDFYVGQAFSEFSDLSDHDYARVAQIIGDYLHRQTGHSEASRLFKSVVRSSDLVDRIHSVITAPDNPLPALPPEDPRPRKRRRRMQMWSAEEDVRLLSGIYRFGLNNWAPIARFVGQSRTRAQCAQRWNRGLDPKISKLPWETNDDVRLMRLVGRYGERAWTIVSAAMGNRSDVQCRYHYHQLRKNLPDEVQAALQRTPDLSVGFPFAGWPGPVPAPPPLPMAWMPIVLSPEPPRLRVRRYCSPHKADAAVTRKSPQISLIDLVKSLMNVH